MKTIFQRKDSYEKVNYNFIAGSNALLHRCL